tara:strand:+ start:1570 stop:1992 length:423 start_codon:yes stop_codon:yes gene_type:complete
MPKVNQKKFKIKKILKKELSLTSKYKTTYKDINKFFKIINKAIFDEKLSPFNQIEIKDIRDGRPGRYCFGQVSILEWKRKGTRIYRLEMQPEYATKRDFVDTLGHEMVHLYQMANLGDTGNHNKLFYSFGPKLNEIGLNL